MPIYTYKNPKTEKTIEVMQSMTDKHEFTDSEGVVYERVFECLNLSSDESIDAFSEKDFADKTRKRTTISGRCGTSLISLAKKKIHNRQR